MKSPLISFFCFLNLEFGILMTIFCFYHYKTVAFCNKRKMTAKKGLKEEKHAHCLASEDRSANKGHETMGPSKPILFACSFKCEKISKYIVHSFFSTNHFICEWKATCKTKTLLFLFCPKHKHKRSFFFVANNGDTTVRRFSNFQRKILHCTSDKIFLFYTSFCRRTTLTEGCKGFFCLRIASSNLGRNHKIGEQDSNQIFINMKIVPFLTIAKEILNKLFNVQYPSNFC